MSLVSYVHYDVNYDNAFWDGQMMYGDGDSEIFDRFTKCIDVIGHEFIHGVTEYEANLAYPNQPGALNESMSDVFGSLVKQRTLKQTAAKADWLIGAGLLMTNINGKALRSMKAPGTAYDDPVLGKDPQPATMKDYVQTTSDKAASISTRAFLTMRSILRQRRSEVMHGRRQERSGTLLCGTGCGVSRILQGLLLPSSVLRRTSTVMEARR